MATVMQKLTTRNFIAIATVLTFLGCVGFSVTHTSAVMVALENPLVTYILGTFTAVVLLVYNFFFRKSQSKESIPDPPVTPSVS